MATETIEFPETPGLTLTAKVFARGGDTVLHTIATVTERTNKKGYYTGDVVDPAVGWHTVVPYVGANPTGSSWDVYLTNTVRTALAGERPPEILNDLDVRADLQEWRGAAPAVLADTDKVSVYVGHKGVLNDLAAGAAMTLTAAYDAAKTAAQAGDAMTLGATGQANVRTAVGLASANLDTQFALLATAASLASAAGDITTLLTRLTSARAEYLDNLNVGGLIASQQDTLNIGNNTRVRSSIPQVLERPDTGSESVTLVLELYDTLGAMEAPDSIPAIELLTQDGTDLSARVGALSNPSTGRYEFVYTNAAAHALETLRWKITVIEGGTTRTYSYLTLLVDTTAVDFTSSDRSIISAIKAVTDLLPNAGSLSSIAQGSDLATALSSLSTLLGRLTALRAGYLDNLSAGAVALEATAQGTRDDTENLQTRIPAALTPDGLMKVDTLRVGGTLQTAADLAALLATIATYIDTEVAAIKAKTDTIPASPATTGDVTSAQAAILAKLPSALIGGRIDASVGDVVAAALAVFFSRNSGTNYGAAVAGSVVKEIADNAGGGGSGIEMATAIPASPTAGTVGDAFASELHWNKGKKEYINNGDGTYTFRIYKYNDPTTVWRSWTGNHATTPSTLVPA